MRILRFAPAAVLAFLLPLSAHADVVETYATATANSIEPYLVSNGGKAWFALSYGSNQTYPFITDGTPGGTVRTSLNGAQRMRFYGLSAGRPVFTSRDLAADSLCTMSATDFPDCASPAAVTEPDAPALFPTAKRYPEVSGMFPFAGGAIYVSTAAFTNGMIGGDRKLGHVGRYTLPSSASSVHVLIPGGTSSPTTATLLGVAGGKAIFQRGDEPTTLRIFDGTTLTSRATTGALSYVASAPGSARLIAQGNKIYGVSADNDEILGDLGGVRARTLFAGKVALLVSGGSSVGLWVTDGTAAGTTKLTVPGTIGNELLATSTSLYALASDGVKSSLYVTNGTAAPTLVRTFGTSEPVSLLGARGDIAYFVVTTVGGGSSTIYRTDGTTAGTTSVATVSGWVNSVRNVSEVVETSPTVGDAVVAYRPGTGVVFIRGATSSVDAGVDASADAAADTAVVADSAADTTADTSADTSAADTSADTAADSAVEDSADSAPVDPELPNDSAIEDAQVTDATSDATEPPADAASEVPAPADSADSGCGCRTGATSSSPFGIALAIAALFARRRSAK